MHTTSMTRNSATAGAQNSPTSLRITPRALLEIKRLGDPQIHPDGARVAFTVYEADFEESRWVSHIWLTEHLTKEAQAQPSDESAKSTTSMSSTDFEAGPEEEPPPGQEELTRQLTFSSEGESDPLWSPDGRYLSFVSTRPDPTATSGDDSEESEQPPQLWTMPMDGGEARRVTNTTEPILDYWWLPDGESLVYLIPEQRPTPLESVHRERERRKFDPTVEHDDPRRRQFWLANVEDRKPQLLFTADHGVESFAVSPDGSRIAYLTNYTGDDNDYHIADLYLCDLATRKSVKLVRREGGKYRLRWSPCGTKIAFLSWHDPLLSYSRESVFIAEVPSAEEITSTAADSSLPLTPGETPLELLASQHEIRFARSMIEAPGIAHCREIELDFDITSFEWQSADSILALAAVGTGTVLYEFQSLATHAEAHAIPCSPQPSALDHSVHADDQSSATDPFVNGDTPHSMPGPLVSPNPGPQPPHLMDRREIAVHPESGRTVWVQESSADPPEIAMRECNGQIHVLTVLNADFTRTYRIPAQTTVRWSSADGQEIEGVLTYPIDYRPGVSYPLMVQVHGGPKGRATETLLDYAMPAVWASEGYIVLRPNYRGSEGYGDTFAVANKRDLGGKDFSDVISGMEWAIASGLADPERIGILGGSYGGFLVNWAIGHTDRFKAAISMFGIFQLQTDYSNSRLSRWEHDYTGAYYWEDPEIYRALSPASYLAQIKTPTLIIHGDEDDNTSISNSREMYRALRQRGIPTQFVHYPREGHGIQEPNHRLDELRRCLGWMDKYVRNYGAIAPVWRVGDHVPHSNGHLELCVTSVEIASFVGRAEPKDVPTSEALLMVTFTIHKLDPRHALDRLTLALSEIQVEPAGSEAEAANAPTRPIGIPLDAPGGKVLVEGDNLRISLQSDPDTGDLAVGASVVFKVQKRGEGSIRVADFPAVEIHWSDEAAADESR